MIIPDYIQNNKRSQELDGVLGNQNILVIGSSPSAKVAITAEKYLNDGEQILLITSNLYRVDRLETDILQYIGHSEIYKYPIQDIMTEEFSAQSS